MERERTETTDYQWYEVPSPRAETLEAVVECRDGEEHGEDAGGGCVWLVSVVAVRRHVSQAILEKLRCKKRIDQKCRIRVCRGES